MTDCLFCKIINREIPASIVYEDDRVLAFNDINPQASTHVLVVPKRHIASLDALQPEDDALIGEVVRRAAAIAAERGIAPGGALIFEFGFGQDPDVEQVVDETRILRLVELRRDLQGIARVAVVRKHHA